MRRKGIRVIEIATAAAVLGILASLAIPNVLRIQARSRVEGLLGSARSCRQELPHWLSQSPSSEPEKKHFVPVVHPDEEAVGAKGVVTNENKTGGSKCEGVLAVYDVEPGTK